MITLLGAVIVSTLSLLHIGNTTADIVRTIAVRGSYRRYVAATIQWALAGPALALAPAGLFFNGFSVWQPLGFSAAALFTWQLFNSDDDNWWRRTRKRLQRWVRQSLSVPRVRPAGAAA